MTHLLPLILFAAYALSPLLGWFLIILFFACLSGFLSGTLDDR